MELGTVDADMLQGVVRVRQVPGQLPLRYPVEGGAVDLGMLQGGLRPQQAQTQAEAGVCPLGEAVGSAILFPDGPPWAPIGHRLAHPLARPGLASRASLPLPPNPEAEATAQVLAKRLSLPQPGSPRALLSATWPPLAGCRFPASSQP